MDEDEPKTDQDRDAALWTHVTRSVAPLAGRDTTTAPPPSPDAPSRPDTAAPKPPPGADAAPSAVQSRETDARTAQRLRQGKLPIEARLDLHGMGRDQARAALTDFILRAHRNGVRHILVVTGKGGRGPDNGAGDPLGPPGILRRSVPDWLDEAPLRAIVLDWHRARPQDGGAGALYILIRRRRVPE